MPPISRRQSISCIAAGVSILAWRGVEGREPDSDESGARLIDIQICLPYDIHKKQVEKERIFCAATNASSAAVRLLSIPLVVLRDDGAITQDQLRRKLPFQGRVRSNVVIIYVDPGKTHEVENVGVGGHATGSIELQPGATALLEVGLPRKRFGVEAISAIEVLRCE